jgi:hypothetical protein
VTHDRRYAIYFVPADDSPLGVFGARLFGRWPDGTPEPDTLAVPEREERTRRVARYGFHATLKAPFALASGCTESGLVDAAAQLAADMNTSSIGPLVVAPEHATVSLQHSGKTNATVVESVSALAARCVVELEPWRAPLDAEARARRKPHQLSEPERGLLETYGYPWVLESFRFHLTLGDRTGDDDRDAAWTEAVAQQFGALVPAAPVFDRIALCREPDRRQPMLRIAEFRLKPRTP